MWLCFKERRIRMRIHRKRTLQRLNLQLFAGGIGELRDVSETFKA